MMLDDYTPFHRHAILCRYAAFSSFAAFALFILSEMLAFR